MKVLFLVGNLYLHAEPFGRIGDILRGLGVESELYYTGDEETVGDGHGIAGNGQAHIKSLNLFRIKPGRSLFYHILQFLGVLTNRVRIHSFLKRERPLVLVTGGDITNINTRLFLDLADAFGIKTVLVPIVIPGTSVVNPSPNKNIPLARLVRYLLRLVKMERTIFFRGWVLGSYKRTALIAVPNEDAKHQLLENGIATERIVVTGNPKDDRIHDLRSRGTEAESDLKALFGCPEASQLIVYCTEVIQDIHGISYFEQINERLFDLFRGLPDDCRIVIKLHPREPLHIEQAYRRRFREGRFLVVRNEVDILTLLKAARFVIGHFSAVLADAALLGATVLSIRILAGNDIPIRFDVLNPFIHIGSYDELEWKCRAAIFDPSFGLKQKDAIDHWMGKAGFHHDGRNAQRIADLIAGQIQEGENEIHWNH